MTTRSRGIGTWGLVFFVVAAAAPLTVMSGVAPLAIKFGGIAAPSGYLLAGVVMALFAVGFTAMTRHVDTPGAFYAYIGIGLGRRAGTGAAFVALMAYALIAISFVPALGVFTRATVIAVADIDLPWSLWSALAVIIIGVLGYQDISMSARILAALLALEVLILVAFAAVVLVSGGAEGISFESFDPRALFGPGLGALIVLAFGAFLGFESTAIFSTETRDPHRTVARATYVAVGFLAIFYTVVLWSAVMAYGPRDAVRVAMSNPETMIFDATAQWLGAPMADVMYLLIVTSALAAALAFHNAAARYLQAIARQGLLPRRLGDSTGRGSPGAASLALSAAAVVIVTVFTVVGADPYDQTFVWLNAIGVPAILALQALCSVAVIAYFRRRSTPVGAWAGFWAPLAAAVCLVGAVIMVAVRYELITGASTAVNLALLAITPLVFVFGFLSADRAAGSDTAPGSDTAAGSIR